VVVFGFSNGSHFDFEEGEYEYEYEYEVSEMINLFKRRTMDLFINNTQLQLQYMDPLYSTLLYSTPLTIFRRKVGTR